MKGKNYRNDQPAVIIFCQNEISVGTINSLYSLSIYQSEETFFLSNQAQFLPYSSCSTNNWLSGNTDGERQMKCHIHMSTCNLVCKFFERLRGLKYSIWDFPGDPVAKTPCSQYRRPGLDPWSGNQIPQATAETCPAQPNKSIFFKQQKI